jgi:outer membrane lipase/esterase
LPQHRPSAQFTSIYYFGDSLTDSGTYKPVLPPGTGLFTTNPGPVWSQVLASRYGVAADPANQAERISRRVARA